MFYAFSLLSIRILDLLLQAARAAFTGLEPFAENCDNLLDIFCLDVASYCVIDFELTVLLVELTVDKF